MRSGALLDPMRRIRAIAVRPREGPLTLPKGALATGGEAFSSCPEAAVTLYRLGFGSKGCLSSGSRAMDVEFLATT